MTSNKLFLELLCALHPAKTSPECINNSAVHDEAFTICFIRNLRELLNLLTDSNRDSREKR